MIRMMFLSSDEGKTWGPPIRLMPKEDGVGEEADFCELPNGDLFWIYRNEHYPARLCRSAVGPGMPNQPCPADFAYFDRWQSVVHKQGDTSCRESASRRRYSPAAFPACCRPARV